MAQHRYANQIRRASEQIAEIDFSGFYRENTGELSLIKLKPKVDSIIQLAELSALHVDDVEDNPAQHVARQLKEFQSLAQRAVELKPTEFANERSDIIVATERMLAGLLDNMGPFLLRSLLTSGLLRGVTEQDRNLSEKLAALESAITRAESATSKADDLFASAEARAAEIIGGARATARGVSLEEAQKQFGHAVDQHRENAGTWGIFSVFSTGVVAILLWWLLKTDYPADMGWGVVPYTLIRFGFVAVAAMFAKFCFSMWRTSLHLSEQNAHRQRIANGAKAFIGAAENPDQRDSIVSRLVEAMAAGYDTGFGRKDDSRSPQSQISIDNVARYLPSHLSSDAR